MQRGEKSGGSQNRWSTDPLSLSFQSILGRTLVHEYGTGIPEIRPGGWAAVRAPPGWGDSERAWGQERGPRFHVACCLGRLGRPGCMHSGDFLGT